MFVAEGNPLDQSPLCVLIIHMSKVLTETFSLPSIGQICKPRAYYTETTYIVKQEKKGPAITTALGFMNTHTHTHVHTQTFLFPPPIVPCCEFSEQQSDGSILFFIYLFFFSWGGGAGVWDAEQWPNCWAATQLSPEDFLLNPGPPNSIWHATSWREETCI